MVEAVALDAGLANYASNAVEHEQWLKLVHLALKVNQCDETNNVTKECIGPPVALARECFNILKRTYEENKDPFNLQKINEILPLFDVLQNYIKKGSLAYPAVLDHFTKVDVILNEMLAKHKQQNSTHS